METRKTIEHNPKMGLNNTVCENPAYYCSSKRVFLSEEDVVCKSCFQRKNADMIGVGKCHMLLTMAEFQENRKRKHPKQNNYKKVSEEIKSKKQYGKSIVIQFKKNINVGQNTFLEGEKRILIFYPDHIEISGSYLLNEEYEKIKEQIQFIR